MKKKFDKFREKHDHQKVKLKEESNVVDLEFKP